MSKTRVHVLAKELKISASALKKTLADLGVVVKSHMSLIDDEVTDKIRAMFNDQLSAHKKHDKDEAIRQEKAQEQKAIEQKKEQTKLKEEAAQAEKRVAAKNKENDDNAQKSLKQENSYKKPSEPKKEYPSKRQEEKKEAPANRTQKTSPPKGTIPLVSTESILAQLKKKSQPATTESYYHADNVEERKVTQQNAPAQDNFRDRRPGGYRGNDSRPPYQGRDNRTGGGAGGGGGTSSNYKGTSDNRRGGYNKDGKPFERKPGFAGKDGGGRFDPKKRDSHNIKSTVIDPIVVLNPDLDTKKLEIAKKFGKNKKSSKDFGDTSRHLQNKIKSAKKRDKYSDIPLELDESQISKNIKMTLKKTKKIKKYHKEAQQTNITEDGVIKISEFTSVSELAKMVGVAPTEIIAKFFALGQMVTINQRLDKDSLELMCEEFEVDYKFEEEVGEEIIFKENESLDNAKKVSRPPIVTIMGHVDHGKTSILDYIRHANVVAGESGGITQHIGAYQITYNDQKITFLDTPGHEAFSAMRARGANLTDIAVIVVAATDGVMPQTVEAIDHAKASGVDIIVAINKVDLPNVNIDKTISQLLEKGVYLEGYGGDVMWTKCSAATGENIDELLDLILLSSEVEDYQAKSGIHGEGIVIESSKDASTGTVITVLLRQGKIKKGDSIICGSTYGKVRKLEDERGKELKSLGPSDVARLYGLNDVPKAGDILNVVDTDKVAKSISSERTIIRRERENFQNKASLHNIFDRIKENETLTIDLIVKADTDGSVEALCDSFEKLSTDKVKVQIIRKSVGGINEADVSLASASNAIILGFHVRTNGKAQRQAELEGVEIKLYYIIYDAIEDLKSAMEGMLAPKLVEKATGSARVKEVFKVKKIGNIAGCAVETGYIENSGKARIYRNDVLLYEGKLSSLKHFANDVKIIKAGTECGIGFENFNDLKEGDVIESYIEIEEKQKL
ncbi:MAG: translation initiation factor IF-2 [Candidatus Cloacimonadales bacterium]